LSPRDYSQERYVSMQTKGKELSEFKAMIAGIDPSAQYEYTYPELHQYQGQTVIMKGWRIKQEFEPFLEQAETGYSQSQQAWQQATAGIRDWDPKTKIVSFDPTYFHTSEAGKIIPGATEGALPGSRAYIIQFPYAGAEYFGIEREGIVRRMTGKEGIGGRYAEMARFVTSAFLKPLTVFEVFGETAFGKGAESAIDRYARTTSEFRGLTPQQLFFKSYEPGGFGFSVTMGVAIGAGIGAASIYGAGLVSAQYGAGSSAALALKTAEVGIGSVMVGMAAGDVARTWIKEEDPAGAFGKIGMHGLMFGSGMYGYKVASQYVTSRGLTFGERGAFRGFKSKIETGIAKGRIEPDIGEAQLQALRSRFGMAAEMRGYKFYQTDPDFYNVQTLRGQYNLQRYFSQKLLSVKKGELFGSISYKTGGVHDIDVMLTPRDVASVRYSARRLGIDLAKHADIKAIQKQGSVVGRMFEFKEPKHITPKGYGEMKWSESWLRLSDSAIETSPSRARWIAELGRFEAKDISSSVKLLTERMFPPGTGSPEMQTQIGIYTKAMAFLARDPQIMSAAEESYLFGSGFRDIIFETKIKFWEKVIPKAWFEKDLVSNLAVIESIVKTPSGGITAMPPSPVSLVPSPYVGATVSMIIPTTIAGQPSSIFKMPSTVMHPTNFVRLYLHGEQARFTTRSAEFFPAPSASLTISPRFISPSMGLDISKSVSHDIYPSFSSISRSFSRTDSSLRSSDISKSLSKSISPSSIRYSPGVSKYVSPSPSIVSPSISRSISRLSRSISISSSSISSSISSSASSLMSSYYFPWFPSLRIYGRGRRGWDFSLFDKKYRWRKFDIGNILKGLGI